MQEAGYKNQRRLFDVVVEAGLFSSPSQTCFENDAAQIDYTAL